MESQGKLHTMKEAMKFRSQAEARAMEAKLRVREQSRAKLAAEKRNGVT